MNIIVFDKNTNSREILKIYLEEIFTEQDNIVLCNDYNQDLSLISEDSIAIVDIALNNKEDFELLERIRKLTSKIIATSTDYSTDIIIKAMRAGAKEFLQKPIIKDNLKQILDIVNKHSMEEKENNSKIITIYSNKGGIGKTTIAANLANELSKTTFSKVALLDLNLQLGDISTFLNLHPGFDSAFVIKNLLDKKDENILNAFERYKDTKVYVLSDPNYIEHSESITPNQIENLFRILKKQFPYIVVDMSSSIDPNTLKILDCSDIILFTTIVNIPAIRNAQRCLNLFKSRHYPENKVKVIINRYMENDEIKPIDIENTIGEEIYWKIPNNYFSVMESINKGVTVSEVNPNSNIADSFRNLAIKISDEIVEQTIKKYRI